MAYLIQCGQLIDGVSAEPKSGMAIRVRNGRITEVDRALSPAEDEAVIDLSGSTVLPGFVDMHTHVGLTTRMEGYRERVKDHPYKLIFRGIRNVEQDLMSGCTTVRSLGDSEYIDIAVRDAVREGRIPGPKILAAGKAAKSSCGHGMMGAVCDGVENLRHWVRQNVAHGANLTKIFATGGRDDATTDPTLAVYSRAEIEALVQESHRIGLPVAAHAVGGQGLVDCIEAGVDTIEHGTWMKDHEIDLLAGSRSWLVLTLSTIFDYERLQFWPPASREVKVKNRETITNTLQKAVKSCARWVLGSDGDHGNFGFEIEAAVNIIGISPADALIAATRRGAEACGVLGSTGTIERGKAADIIALGADPLQNISAVYDVRFVMRDGVVYKGAPESS